MSEPIYPLAPWQQNTLDNSIPANTNWLRQEAINRRVLSKTTTAQPGSPADGDVYIIPAAATGAQWATFSENDIAIFRDGTWYAYAPVEGVIANVSGILEEFTTGGGWAALSGSGIAPVVTESGTNLDATDANYGNYTRFTNAGTKTYSFDSTESYVIGTEYHGRNVGAGDLTISEVGTFVMNEPAGGTLVIPQGGTFTVKIVGAAEADLFGVTEPSS